METRITPLNRWFYIRKTKSKIRLANRCIDANTKAVNLYLKLKDEKSIEEHAVDFKTCAGYIDAAMALKEKWTWLLRCLEEGEVYSIDE